jgi:putative flippase GtrA
LETIKKALEIELIRFAIGGASGLILGYAAFIILTDWFGVWYLVSSMIAFVVNYGGSFYVQKYWTFRNREENKTMYQLMLYCVFVAAYFFLSTGLMYVFVNNAHIMDEVAQKLVMIITSIASFFSTRAILQVKN